MAYAINFFGIINFNSAKIKTEQTENTGGSAMCTAVTYKTAGFYFGRTLDYDCSYSESVTVMPRRFPLSFREMGTRENHYAIIGMAHVADG